MVDPIVGYSLLSGSRRQAVVDRCHELETELAALDDALAEAARRRKAVVDELRQHRDKLITTLQRRGRQPAPDGGHPLPPVPAHARFVRGRRLRAVCRALLARFGVQTLVQLHGLLHRHGYAVDGDDTAKVLADALGYDHDHGRVARVGRGVYAPTGSPPPRVMRLLDF